MTRRLLFLLFGLLLGGVSVAALANAPTRIPLNVPVSAPAGVVVSGAWDAMIPGINEGYRASDFSLGSGEVYRGVAVRVDGVPAQLSASRRASALAIARRGASLAARGPYGIIGGLLLDAGWDYVQDHWVRPDLDSAPQQIPSGTPGWSEYDLCFKLSPGQTIVMTSPSNHAFYVMAYPNQLQSGYTVIGNCINKPGTANGFPQIHRRVVMSPYIPDYSQVSATPGDIEGLLNDNLLDGGLDPADALQQLVESGDMQDSDFEPTVVTGPSSITGPTTTSTTSGPAGQTSTTTQNRYDMEYVPSGVIIRPTTTTSTTTPDGQTTTSTTTTTGASGQAPQKPAEPEKPLCELFPDASGCEKLGNPAEDITLQTRDLDISSLNYQSVSGSCPGPKTIATSHGSYELSYEPVCTAADFLRPVIVLSGLLTAGIFVFMGARRAS